MDRPGPRRRDSVTSSWLFAPPSSRNPMSRMLHVKQRISIPAGPERALRDEGHQPTDLGIHGVPPSRTHGSSLSRPRQLSRHGCFT